jgi:hypothetical protein
VTRISKTLATALIIPLLCLALAGCQHTVLSVEITWPFDGATVYATPVPVTGAVSDPSASVTINNTPVVVAENGYFIGSVDLIKGENTITVVAKVVRQKPVIKTTKVIYAPGG